MYSCQLSLSYPSNRHDHFVPALRSRWLPLKALTDYSVPYCMWLKGTVSRVFVLAFSMILMGSVSPRFMHVEKSLRCPCLLRI